jgi:protein TonB
VSTATGATFALAGSGHTAAAGTTAGVGQPGSTGEGTASPQLAGYLRGVRERVTRHREYPYLARRANLEGTVCLRVSIAASGSVLDVKPTCGTGHAPLLQAALKSVSSAAPFPPLPAALGPRLTVDVPVVFELDEL